MRLAKQYAVHGVAVGLACVLHSGIVQADERITARLSYATADGVERCPDARNVRDAVASRLGYDPFDAVQNDATRDVILVVKRKGAGIVGVLDIKGPHPGHRELESASSDCREVIDALTVAIAIGLDPASLTRPPDEPPPPPLDVPPPPSAPPPPEPPPPAPRAEPPETRIRIGAGPLVALGELPAPAPALTVSGAVRWKRFEPILEGMAVFPVKQSSARGSVEASLLTVTLLPCIRLEPLFACGGATIGALRGEGSGISAPLHASAAYAAATVRGGVDVPLGRSLFVRGFVDAAVPFTRISLQLAAQDVWRMPSVAARVGASVGVSF